MTGRDFYKIEVNKELSAERMRSLVFFYRPLIGNDAMALYLYFFLNGTTSGFKELNPLLQKLNISVDAFERDCRKLNEFMLLKTLRKENRYVFFVNEPLTRREFVEDDVLVRCFILNAGGDTYRAILSEVTEPEHYDDYENISSVLPANQLENWTDDNESYLKRPVTRRSYDFGTLFDINYFLKGMTTNLFPQRFRTESNLKEIARMADLYNVSNDKMRFYITKVCDLKGDTFDLKQLRYLCSNGNGEETEATDPYNVPNVQFLMKLQDGKKVTETDKYILNKLSSEYELSLPVINALLEYIMKRYDNTIVPSTVYSYANNLHRNDIKTAEEAIKWLDGSTDKSYKKQRKDIIATYDESSNPEFDEERYREIMNRRNRK